MCTSSELNSGAGAARNRAVAASSGAVLVIQDADDVMRPQRIAVQVAALLAESCQIYAAAQGDSTTMPPQFSRVGSGGEGGSSVDCLGTMLLVGSRFDRLPSDATHHYTAWANGLSRYSEL